MHLIEDVFTRLSWWSLDFNHLNFVLTNFILKKYLSVPTQMKTGIVTSIFTIVRRYRNTQLKKM